MGDGLAPELKPVNVPVEVPGTAEGESDDELSPGLVKVELEVILDEAAKAAAVGWFEVEAPAAVPLSQSKRSPSNTGRVSENLKEQTKPEAGCGAR